MEPKRFTAALAAASALAGTVLLATPAAAADCAGLGRLSLPHARITLAQAVSGGTFVEDNAVGRAGRTYGGLPDFCRVRGVSTPVPGSEIEFEVWLPARERWTQRLHMVGNGAYVSNLPYPAIIARIKRGDVAVATNTGHVGSELTFVIGKPESIIDFSHRAVHESVVAAKAVTNAFYGAPAARSYFSGCSTGGYQGLSEAQRYPDDFDGIIAGAPGNNRSNLNLAFLWNFKINHRPGDDATPILPQTKLPMITAAVIKACDGLDGVVDGVVNDPRACRFNPAAIQCAGADAATCLTAEQVDVVRKFYKGPTDARTGKPIYPGYLPGTEGVVGGEDASSPGWSAYWGNPKKPEPLRLDFFRYWVFNDPDWNWKAFNWGSDIDAIDAKVGATFNAVNPDLSAFRRRGGKMIMFMGWQDPVGAAEEAINYYDAVKATSKAKGAAARQVDTQAFLRLFMVPGMAHCAGGPGATNVSTATRNSEPPVSDATHDMAIALEEWVEHGRTPEALIATRFDKPAGDDRKILFQRPLCPYPKLARYKGGPQEKAESFACAAPKASDRAD
ncbi:tannase/feruloyl esterase family alpha/beta hydrolase [Caulobacter segnis]